MRWPWRKASSPREPRSPRRRFVTPEGVDLQLELGAGGARAGAFTIDLMLQLAILVGASLALVISLAATEPAC